MKYVYFLQSIDHPDRNYVGLTDDLRNRVKTHNAGGSSHTAKYKPWRLVTYVAFSDEAKATAFEQCMKGASGGRAFAKNGFAESARWLLFFRQRLRIAGGTGATHEEQDRARRAFRHR